MSSRRALVAFASTPQGLPGSSTDLSPRAVPNHPGRPAGCLCLLLRQRHLASSQSADWPPSYSYRGRIGFTCVTAHGFASRVPLAPLLEPWLVRLRVEQAIYTVNSFQFTRSARLILATDRRKRSCRYISRSSIKCRTASPPVGRQGAASRWRGAVFGSWSRWILRRPGLIRF